MEAAVVTEKPSQYNQYNFNRLSPEYKPEALSPEWTC
jgi:hypothetical protein